jgi:hypothetical protein
LNLKEENNFDYWKFIEKYYPKYDHCDDVLLSDILSRKLDGQEICEDDEKMIKDWDVKAELLKIDQMLLSEALANYFDIILKEL